MSYRVELPVFSGPMDLLLHLVRQSEVDIHEVAIAKVLDDYLGHLKVLQQLDLHDIGDFVVMASTLMEIKSRELLPNESIELEEELDPRDDLIRRLLEYKRYRDLARELDTRSTRRARQSQLVMAQPPELRGSKQDEDLLDIGEVGIWDLTSAFAKLLDQIGQQQSMEIEVEKRDVGYYTHTLLDSFKAKREVRFSEVFDKSEGRYGMIGTLIALLEMMKQGYLRAFQENCSDDIQLAYTGGEEVRADQILAGITADELAAQEAQDKVRLEKVRLEKAAEGTAESEPSPEAGPDADQEDDQDDVFDEDAVAREFDAAAASASEPAAVEPSDGESSVAEASETDA
ncbi:MAG: ScpA family protein [Planctomycetota bacterium]